jgi:very-short-patch-repair endonuclease
MSQWLSNSDFVWREQKVVAEFDGDHHRTDRRQWQDDVARCQNLQDDGWAFVQLTYASVMLCPRNKSTVTRLRHLLTPRSRTKSTSPADEVAQIDVPYG